MKVLFIAPCLEIGKDGVGDYTFQLANEIERQGHEYHLLAWNDHHITEVETSPNSLRLPSNLPEKDKSSLTMSWLSKISPDWVSLQWVPHGYHPRGLFYPQISALGRCMAGLKTHLMIHEIWLGAKAESSLKESIYGIIQKRLFRKLITTINPRIIHTQAKAYHLLLEDLLNQPIEILPLFGNIPPVRNAPQRDNEIIKSGFFGSIHSETKIDTFAEQFIQLGKQTQKPLQIEHAGNCSEAGIEVFESWKRSWGDNISFYRHGSLDNDDVSAYLHSLHFGLSSNPIALTDKSGSIAAMLEHDLPVIKLRDDVSFNGYTPSFDKQIILTHYHTTDLFRLIEYPMTVPNKPSLKSIATQFMETLKGEPT